MHSLHNDINVSQELARSQRGLEIKSRIKYDSARRRGENHNNMEIDKNIKFIQVAIWWSSHVYIPTSNEAILLTIKDKNTKLSS